METSIIINKMTAEQINSLFKGLQNQITDLKQNLQPKEPPEYMTRAEVAKMLSIDLSTIHNWCKKGKLKPKGIGSRVYFLRSDIAAVLIPIGKKTGGSND